MQTDQIRSDREIGALSAQLAQIHLTPPPPPHEAEVKDLDKLVAHGLTDAQGAFLSPKTLPVVPITDEMKAAMKALLMLPRPIGVRTTTLEALITMATDFLLEQRVRLISCLLVDEEIYKILGYDYLKEKFLHVVGDANGTIETYLSNELHARFKQETKKPLDTLTVRFLLPRDVPDDIRHILLTKLYKQFSTAFGSRFSEPFLTNDENHLSGFTIVSSELRLHLVFCTQLEIPCFSTLSAQQIELIRKDNQSYNMRVVDHDLGAQSTVDIIFKNLRLIPNKSTHQAPLLLRLVRRDFQCLEAALKAFEAELFGQHDSVTRLFEFYERECRKHSSDEDRIRDLFLIAQIGSTLGYHNIVDRFVALALPKHEVQIASFWTANAALLKTLTFSEWRSLSKLFSPLLDDSQSIPYLGTEISQRDLAVYLTRAAELHALPAFAAWLSYFLGTPQLQQLPSGCAPLLTAIHSDPASLQKGYLACLAFAISSHDLELARYAFRHFSAAQKVFAEPIQKVVDGWMATLMHAHGFDMPQKPSAMIETLLASPHFNKTGLELLLASPAEYQKIKLSQIPHLLTKDMPLALRFIEQVQDKAGDHQIKEWIQRCPQKALLFDILVRTGNPGWIKLCVENNPQIAWSLYPCTQSQALLEEVTSRSTDAGLFSVWAKCDAPLEARTAQRLLQICLEHATASWSQDFVACVKLCRHTLDDKEERHIVDFLPICLQPQALDHFPDIVVAAFLFLSKKNQPLTRSMRLALLADPEGRCSTLKRLNLAETFLIYVKQLYPRYANGTPLPDEVLQAASWAEKQLAPPKPAAAAPKNVEQKARTVGTTKPKSKPPQSHNWNAEFEKALFDPSATARLIRKVIGQPDGGNKELWQLVSAHATPLNMTESLFLIDQLELLKKYLTKSDLQKLLRLFVPMIAAHKQPHQLLLKAHEWFLASGENSELGFDLLECSDKDSSKEFFEKQCGLLIVIVKHLQTFIVRTKHTIEKHKSKESKVQKTYRFSAFVKFIALAKKHLDHALATDTVVLIVKLLEGFNEPLVACELVQILASFPSPQIKEALVPLLPGFSLESKNPSRFVPDLLEGAPFALVRQLYQAFITNHEKTIYTLAKKGVLIDAPTLYQSLATRYGWFLSACAQLADPDVSRETLEMDFVLSRLPCDIGTLMRNQVADYYPLIEQLFITQLGRFNWDDRSMHFYDQYVIQQLTPLEIPRKRIPSCLELPQLTWEEYPAAITFMQSRPSYQGFLMPESVKSPGYRVSTLVPRIWKAADALLPTEKKYIEVIAAFIEQLVEKVKTKGPTLNEKAIYLDTIAENLRLLIELYPKASCIATLLERYVPVVETADAFYPIHKKAVTALIRQACRHGIAQNLAPLAKLQTEIQALLDDPKAALTEDMLFTLQSAFLEWQELHFVDAFEEREACLMKFFALWKKYPACTTNRSVFDTMATILSPYHRYFGFHHGAGGKEHATRITVHFLKLLCELNAQELISPHLPVVKVGHSNGREVRTYTTGKMGTLFQRIDIFVEALDIIIESRILDDDYDLLYPFLEKAISLITTDRKIEIELCLDLTAKLSQILCMPVATLGNKSKRIALQNRLLLAMEEASGQFYDKVMTLIGRGIARGRIVLDFTEQGDLLLCWMRIFDRVQDQALFKSFGEQLLKDAIEIDKILPEKILPKAPGRFRYNGV